MRSALISTAIVGAAAAAAPQARADDNIDGVILNYALTLEHLERTFYDQALQLFTEEDFRKAGVNPEFYCNLKEIAHDEETHVSFLTTALEGAKITPVEKCTYDFGAPTVENYLATANILEGVGVSAYLGAAQFITTKAYLTAAASILTVEARHSAYLRDNQLIRESPFPSPFDIPLDFDQVYSLAALFIKECPSTNPTLPVKAFPAFTAAPAGFAKVGDKLTLTVAKSVDAKAAYFATINGPVAATLSGSGTSYTVTVPEGVQGGQEYLSLTSTADKPTDDNIVAIGIIQIVDNVTNTTTTDARYKGWKWNSRHF